ncbi:MAG: EAL domain-containing protein [Bacilli bacterium]
MKNKFQNLKLILLFLLICIIYFIVIILLLSNLNIVELYELSILFSLALFSLILFIYSFFINNKFVLFSSLSIFILSVAEIIIIKFSLIPLGIESITWLNIVFQAAVFIISLVLVIGIIKHYNYNLNNHIIRQLSFEKNEAILIVYNFEKDSIKVQFSKEYENKWNLPFSNSTIDKIDFLNYIYEDDRLMFNNFLEVNPKLDSAIIIRFLKSGEKDFGYVTFKNRIKKDNEIIFLGVDTTSLQKAFSKIEQADKSKAIILDKLNIGILELELINEEEKKFNIIYANKASENEFKLDKSIYLNKIYRSIFPDNYEVLCEMFGQIIKQNIKREYELYHSLNKSWYRLVGYKSDDNKAIIIFDDITNFKNQEKEQEYRIFHDSLTDLYNNRGLHRRLSDFVNSKRLICFYIDIVDFSWINSYYPMAFSDNILVVMANELKDNLKENVVISRYFTDHFVILLEDPTEEDVQKTLNFLKNSSGKTYGFGNHSLNIRKNIGYAIYPDDTKDIKELVFLSNLAMKMSIENKGVEPFHYFPGLKEKKEDNIKTIALLKEAIINKDITVYFQKVIDIRNNEVVMVEALARWKKSDGTFVPPLVFLKIAIEAKIISLLENLLISESLRKYSELIKLEEYKNTKLSINLSPSIFLDINTINFIKDKLKLYNLTSDKIYIEVSEETFVYNLEKCNYVINLYRENGFKIAIDDFGSSYSSLSILDNIDYEVLKIDGKFIQNFNQIKNQKIIEMVLQIASIDNKRIVAEGVETKEMVDYLYSVDCFVYQGYYFHIPENIIK